MKMKKLYYDQRCVRCPGCAFFRPQGPRPESTLDPTAVWPDACRFYGYAFHEYPELAQDCDGFKTPSQYQRELEMKNRKEKKK